MKIKIFFLLIIILASMLRIYKISSLPVSLYWDEVSIGYNAYSILKTGKDEWGAQSPLLFKAFGEYKLPAYIYTTSFFENVFGPSEIAIRLPSALSGVGTVILTFFLIVYIFDVLKNKDKLIDTFYSKKISFALISSLLVATSPWLIQFNRAGFEASLALFLTMLGLVFFFKAIKSGYIYFILSSLFFSVSIYTYNSSRLFTPLIIGALIILFRKCIPNFKVSLLIFIVSFVIFISPFLPTYFSKEGLTRVSGESIFQLKGNLVDNFIVNFVSNLDSKYLFFKGDTNLRHSVGQIGELFIWQLPFTIIALFLLARYRSKFAIFLLFWLLAAVLPVALSRISPHSLRGLIMAPVWQLICTLGFLYIFKKVSRLGFIFVILPIFLANFIVYQHTYYLHYPIVSAQDWQDGQKQAVLEIEKIQNNYDHIFVQRDLHFLYILFYSQYNPAYFQESGHNINKIGKYEYVNLPVDLPINSQRNLVLAVPDYNLAYRNAKLIKKIAMSNGDIIFYLYEY